MQAWGGEAPYPLTRVGHGDEIQQVSELPPLEVPAEACHIQDLVLLLHCMLCEGHQVAEKLGLIYARRGGGGSYGCRGGGAAMHAGGGGAGWFLACVQGGESRMHAGEQTACMQVRGGQTGPHL